MKMKKDKIFLTSAVALIALAAASCDDYNDQFNIDDTLTDVRNATITLAAGDYSSIANNATNKALAKSLDEAAGGTTYTDALAAVGANNYFTTRAAPEDYIPAFLATSNDYRLADVGSRFTVNVNFYKDPSGYLSDFDGVSIGTYDFTEADYESIWGDAAKASYITPATLSQVPGILGNAVADAQDGDMVVVNYAYSENEPSIGGGSADDEPNYTPIADVVAKWTGIPVTKITESEKDRLLHLEDILHKRVVGQNEAVSAVAKAIRRSRVGLQDSKRPIGSFLFMGQTGVGKTELCKAIAEAMFDDENNIVRIDMSEYMESHSVSKLIGSPPGYVGFEEGGQLTEAVRRHPYSVVLFDEIEKAHPDIFNALLQILDDGRLTDGQGRTVSFKNTIIIMTSNLGANEVREHRRNLGFGGDDSEEIDSKKIYMDALKHKFKPEFINRIDVICVFQPLTHEDLVKIAKILISNINKRLKEKNLSLKITEDALDYVVSKGSNTEYGARPLKRFIQQEIEDNIAEMILMGKLKNEGTIIIDVKDDELSFENE